MKLRKQIKEQIIAKAMELMFNGYCAEDAVYIALDKRASKISSKDYDELIDLAIDKQNEMCYN